MNNSTSISLPVAPGRQKAPYRVRRFTERYYTYRALGNAYRNALHISEFRPFKDRYVVLSDVHKGDGNRATDDFVHNVPFYLHALRYYLNQDFRLVLNGDIEECWKSNNMAITEFYEDTAFATEREFADQGQHYYMRTYGNHDDDWADPRKVKKYLHPVLGQSVRVYPAVRLGNHIMIAHGHQGDLTSDRMSWLSRRAVRYAWRPVQGLLKIKDRRHTSNNSMQSARDRFLNEWAIKHHQLLIAGHTHRALLQPDAPTATDHYINTGCCILADGITAIEIDHGEIRLVRWAHSSSEDGIDRTVFKSRNLAALLRLL